MVAASAQRCFGASMTASMLYYNAGDMTTTTPTSSNSNTCRCSDCIGSGYEFNPSYADPPIVEPKASRSREKRRAAPIFDRKPPRINAPAAPLPWPIALRAFQGKRT